MNDSSRPTSHDNDFRVTAYLKAHNAKRLLLAAGLNDIRVAELSNEQAHELANYLHDAVAHYLELNEL